MHLTISVLPVSISDSTSNSTTAISSDGFLIFGRGMDATLLIIILGITLALATLVGVTATVIRRKQLRRPRDFCFSLPAEFYSNLERADSVASSGRFFHGSLSESDSILHNGRQPRRF